MKKSKSETKKGKQSKTLKDEKKQLGDLAFADELNNGLIDADLIVEYKISNNKVKNTDNLKIESFEL